MSPINYHLELPTQWSIHPVFHIDLLTPYRETITHGANYQCPPPDLVDNAEEYEVEKILDSWLFGRRQRLQYLVKWKGYPDSDNMWVDKDDVFADDKVRTFKESNPEARTHLRAIRSTTIPHSPLASSRASSTSYYTPPSTETTINPRLLSLPICHSMQHTPRTPPTTPSPTTPTTPQRTHSPAPHQKSPTPPSAQTPYQSHHDHSWRASTLWDQYICTQGLRILDPLYKSMEPRQRVKKPQQYAATLEECFHQEQMALLGQPTNGQRLTRGLLGKIMDQDRKSHWATS